MTIKERIAKEREEEERLGKLCMRCYSRFRGDTCESMTCRKRVYYRNREGYGSCGKQSSSPDFEADVRQYAAIGSGNAGTLWHGTGGGTRIIRSSKPQS